MKICLKILFLKIFYWVLGLFYDTNKIKLFVIFAKLQTLIHWSLYFIIIFYRNIIMVCTLSMRSNIFQFPVFKIIFVFHKQYHLKGDNRSGQSHCRFGQGNSVTGSRARNCGVQKSIEGNVHQKPHSVYYASKILETNDGITKFRSRISQNNEIFFILYSFGY